MPIRVRPQPSYQPLLENDHDNNNPMPARWDPTSWGRIMRENLHNMPRRPILQLGHPSMRAFNLHNIPIRSKPPYAGPRLLLVRNLLQETSLAHSRQARRTSRLPRR